MTSYYDSTALAKRMDDDKRDYEEAYRNWRTQLMALHRVLLEGEPLEPPKLKALLSREARVKQRYDRARRALPGISEEE